MTDRITRGGRATVALVLVWLLGVTASAAVRAADAGVITLGVAGPQTGDLASYGIPASRAAEFRTRREIGRAHV